MTTTNDAFGTLRFLIALGHRDGEFSKAEKQFVRDRMNYANLSVDQKSILTNDFETPQSPEALFSSLTLSARAKALSKSRSEIQRLELRNQWIRVFTEYLRYWR